MLSIAEHHIHDQQTLTTRASTGAMVLGPARIDRCSLRESPGMTTITDTDHPSTLDEPLPNELDRSPDHLLRALTAIPFLAVILWIAVLDPYYGPMDDANLLGMAHWIWSPDYWATWWSAMQNDVTTWGMIRPFYWALAELQYQLGHSQPIVLFAVNWAVTTAVLVFAGVAMTRVFVVPVGRRPLFMAAYAAAAIGFPWTLDLYAFPSLQEKWVILAAAIGFWWFSRPRERFSAPGWYAISLLVIVAGSLTKAQFVVFLPAFALLTLDTTRERKASPSRLLFVIAVSVIVAAALRIVATYGSYTTSYGLQNVSTQLHSKYLWLLVALGAVWSVYAIRVHRSAGSRIREFVPIAVLVTFIGVFLQWNSFLFSVISFVAAASLALVVSRIDRRGLALAAVGVAVVCSLGWSWARAGELFGSLSSIGQFTRSAEIRQLAEEGRRVYVSCSEGSHAFARYAQREAGVTVRFDPGSGPAWSVAKGTAPPPGFTWAFVDDHMCPAVVDSSTWTAVWRPSRAGGFTLYQKTIP